MTSACRTSPSPTAARASPSTGLIKLRRPWKTLSDVELTTAEYIDRYDHRRLHGGTGHVSPAEYRNNHHRATTKPQVTTNN
ncbi:IS3 family transposase [Streptomyces sp. sk2.1]|uniref:IS3 family transposase n=1 Tax=Streptomyces sp. sk2.1 TaxID=2478959 RepID=UPI001653001B